MSKLRKFCKSVVKSKGIVCHKGGCSSFWSDSCLILNQMLIRKQSLSCSWLIQNIFMSLRCGLRSPGQLWFSPLLLTASHFSSFNKSVKFQHSQQISIFCLSCYCFIMSEKVRTERMCLVFNMVWTVLDHPFRKIFLLIYVMYQNFHSI